MIKILVVEDEVNIRETLVDILEAHAYEVISASNGLIGSIKAVKDKPDLIISDINMPEMDGFEMLEALKGCMEEVLIPPFIFLTAKVEKSDMRKAMNLGADDYITKPFKNQELFEAIQTKLDKRKEVEGKIISKERTQISGELHDSIQQLLVASYMGFETLSSRGSFESPNDQAIFKSAFELLKQANSDLRSYAHNIGKKESIENIAASLQAMADSIQTTSGIKFKVTCSLEAPLTPELQTQLYRIVQESVSNILKHAKATTASIELQSSPVGITLRVIDDGIGFDAAAIGSGMGMANLKERVHQIGADLRVVSLPNMGTTVEVVTQPVLE